MRKVLLLLISSFLIATNGYCADRYWIGDAGNWNSTDEWSTSSGGAGGASVPGVGDNAYIDVNSLSANGTISINVAASVTNLIITGLDFRLNLSMSNNLTCSGTFQSDGQNVTTGRTFIHSNTFGTARTITAATVSVSNTDFRDITGAGAGNWDISDAIGGSGNAQGNSGITFTTADDWYWYSAGVGAGTYNMEDYTYWYTATNGGGSQMASTRVVLPQDNMYFDSNSISGSTIIDQNMSIVCNNFDTTGVDAVTFHFQNVDQQFSGGMVLDTNVSTQVSSGDQFYFYGLGSYNIDNNGKNIDTPFFYSGTYTLISNFNVPQNSTIQLYDGTFDANDYNVYGGAFQSSNSMVRTLSMGSGTWSFGLWSGTHWSLNTNTNLTFNAETSTIVFRNTISGNGKFYGGGLTYNDFTIEAPTGTTTIYGPSTIFNTLTIEAPTTLKFTDGTTTTVSAFVATGTSGNEITLTGTSTAGWTISDTTGTNAVEYCDISYSTAQGGATWNAFTLNGNTNSGNNSGWTFSSTAAEAPVLKLQGIMKLQGTMQMFL